MRMEVDLVTKILEHKGVKVLVYTGQNDLICNTPGTFKWIEESQFTDAAIFRYLRFYPERHY